MGNTSVTNKKRIKWAVKIDDRQETLAAEGESVEIEIREEWEGKEILVMAYRRSPLEEVSQRTKINSYFVTNVDGPANATPKTKAKYRVKEYNKDTIGENIKREVKWAIKIEEEQTELAMEGETIEIEDNWLNKDILVMAYLVKPITRVSKTTKIQMIDGKTFRGELSDKGVELLKKFEYPNTKEGDKIGLHNPDDYTISYAFGKVIYEDITRTIRRPTITEAMRKEYPDMTLEEATTYLRQTVLPNYESIVNNLRVVSF
jgi:hypothetical protein